MTVVVWVAEGTWPACVDAAARWAPADVDVVLAHVPEPEVAAAAHVAFTGLLGRGHRERDPGGRLAAMGAEAAREMLAAAASRLGRPCTVRELDGRPEHALVEAADGVDLLVLARDGDLAHRGPRSLGPVTRFVVDHAACPVMLVWPGTAPAGGPPPPRPGGPPPPPPRR